MGYRNKKSLNKGKKINKRTANKFKNTGYENIIKGGVNTPPKAIAPDNLVDPRAHQKCKDCNRWINKGQDKSAVCSQYECQYCPICINPQPPEPVFVSPNPTLSLSPEPEQSIVSPSSSEQSIVSPSSSEQSIVSPSSSEQPVVSPSSSEQPVVSPSSSEQRIVSPSSSEQRIVSPSSSEQRIVSPSSSEFQYGDSVYSSASSDEDEIENIDDFLDQVILKLQEILDL